MIDTTGLPVSLQQIAKKVEANERISTEECLELFEKADLGFLGALANLIRNRKHGDKTYFNKNFHRLCEPN